ncbi:MAG: radical SAM protein [Clostridiales bacterium]|nr:radical SAM protein [Clostridiales bacterium]
MKHINIPIFIPHLGCPNNCVFCNQKTISGVQCFDISSVDRIISAALSTIDQKNSEVEIAFFGGSFTGIEPALMTQLLEIAADYVQKGVVHSIRLSTRPDYINHDILTTLKQYPVRHIELGVQSLDDEVLKASDRGHTAKQSFEACRLIKEYGFSLTGQMMLGLPLSTLDKELKTAETLALWGIDSARIYPTVVFKDTPLAEKMKNGTYTALTTQEAIERSAAVLGVFDRCYIPVIRIGLCSQDELFDPESVLSHNFHSALGECAQSTLYYHKIEALIEATPTLRLKERLTIFCPPGHTSKVVGHRKSNLLKLQANYAWKEIKIVEKNTLFGYNILID